MRWGVLIFAALLTGCAAHPKPASTALIDSEPLDALNASVLAFDPPIAQNLEPIDLSRDIRQPMVFAGYEDTSTTLSYLRIDDRQSEAFGDRYERRAVSERITARYR